MSSNDDISEIEHFLAVIEYGEIENNYSFRYMKMKMK